MLSLWPDHASTLRHGEPKRFDPVGGTNNRIHVDLAPDRRVGMNRFKPGFPRWIGFRLAFWRFFARKFRILRSKKRLVLLSPAAPAVIGLYLLA
jgi:hypothetical protein